MVARILAEVFSWSLLHSSETLKSILDILAMLPDLGSYITGLTSSVLGTYADFEGIGKLKIQLHFWSLTTDSGIRLKLWFFFEKYAFSQQSDTGLGLAFLQKSGARYKTHAVSALLWPCLQKTAALSDKWSLI